MGHHFEGTKAPQSGAPRTGPTPQKTPKKILHLFRVPNKKRTILVLPVSRRNSVFPPRVPPFGVVKYDSGKNAQPRGGGRKTELRRGNGVTSGSRRTLSHPAPRSDKLVFPPRGKDHCTKVLPARGGTTSRSIDGARFEGVCPDTDALLVLDDFVPIRGRGSDRRCPGPGKDPRDPRGSPPEKQA